jgi:transketolase
MRLADHCGLALSELAATDARIRVLDGDLADSDGAVHFAERFPDRFLMSGIAEQSMVSVAAGMASCGLRPWVFSFAAFLCYRAYDQIRVTVSQARQPVTLVGSHSGGCSGRNGKTHAAVNDIALMASLPSMQVWAPAGPMEVGFACREILAGNTPAYIRLPRRPLDDLHFEPAAARWIGKPAKIALLSHGLGTHIAVDTRDLLCAEGINAGVLHCARVKPLPKLVLEALREIETAFVIEDHSTFGGLASLIQQHAPHARVVPIGWPADWPGQSGDDLELLRLHGLSPAQIAVKIAREH